MEVTAETKRTRWIGLPFVWVLLAGVLYLHATVVRDYVDRISRLGLRGAPVASTPMQRICPTGFADAEAWVRHALALADGVGPQLRRTDTDNAPYGREVHWNSGFAWTIAGAGWLRHAVTGEPQPQAMERSLAWFNLPLLLGVVVLFSACVSRRAGFGAGVLLALLMVGNPDFYAGFSPNYVDHHGLLAAATLGLVLGAVFMGLGFRAVPSSSLTLLPSSVPGARSAAIFSAVCGAVGMWISAATLIPAIALTGAIAAIVILGCGRNTAAQNVRFEPGLWRLWGKVGAALSFAFYLLEYAPHHLGFRLEVNHPLYALAWRGGAEIIAQIGEGRSGVPHQGAITRGASKLSGDRVSPRAGIRSVAWWGRLALFAAVLAVAAAPVVIGVWRERVFVVFDPFIARLSAYVSEGLSLPETIRLFGWGTIIAKVPWFVATLLASIVLLWRGRSADRIIAAFATALCAALLSLSVAQARWWPSASAAMIVLILVGYAALVSGRKPATRWNCVAGIVVLLCAPAIVGRIYAQVAANRAGAIAPDDALQPLYRDIASAIRAAQPTGAVVLLASPNASAGISYYGGFKSIGTLYWENLAGAKAAAEMFSASDETEARRLIRQRGVTHVVMISDTNFLAEYFDLLHPGAGAEALRATFGYALLVGQPAPIWLTPIPYESPPDVPLHGIRLSVFATRFSEPEAEALYEAAAADINAGRLGPGEAKLDQALDLAPQSAEFWLIKAHLLLARNDGNEAVKAEAKAIACASPAQRYPLYGAEAVRLYQAGARVAAAELYRRSLAVQFDLTTANNLIWILATSSDDQARNGSEALQVAELIVRDHSDYLSLSGYAAALAECGRFREAADIATRAVAAARSSRNEALLKKAESCLTAYRSGHPWRE